MSLPPKLPHRFFRWYLPSEVAEAHRGRFDGLYQERRRENGKRKADRDFLIDVLFLFGPR
jgi:hypothetical protein